MADHRCDSSDEDEYWINYVKSKTRAPKIYMDRKHPFDELDDKKFKERFRLNKATVLRILEIVENKLEYSSDRNKSVTPMNQLLIALRFYATGTFQLVVGDTFGVDKSTCCRIIQKVTPILASMSKEYVKFPKIDAERRRIMGAFYANSGFPGIIGAIDCTHVPIFSPGGSTAEVFRNRKSYFSLNVHLICDPDLYVLDVVARWPGSVHDSTIFDFSNIRAKFENNCIPEGYLIGDSGYACRSYLMTPVSEPVNSEKEKNYNIAHVQARNCIERTNEVIKRRFPALKYRVRIHSEKIPEMIVAIVVLHNIARSVGDSEPPNDTELATYMDNRRKEGFQVDFEDVEAEPPSFNRLTGFTSQRSAVIENHF